MISRTRQSQSKLRVEPLESRTMLASAVAAMGPLAISKPSVQLLVDLTKLPTKTANMLRAAHADLFKPAANIGAAKNNTTIVSQPASKASAFTFDFASLKRTLLDAPLEFTKAAKTGALTFAIPTPDGSFARFSVLNSPIMEAPLAAKFPSIKTFVGQGIDDKNATVRLDYTPLGFHAQVLSPNGAYYVEPYYRSDSVGTYVSFYKRNAIANGSFDFDQNEALADGQKLIGDSDKAGGVSNPATSFAGTLKTYRAAVAADGEFTAKFGGTVTGGLAAVTTTMNRVTGVYETELDIRMTLVANENLLIYTNAATDPYANTSNDINVNTGNCNTVIGSANYDIGHVVTTGSGGVAQLGCVGKSTKGAGTTGQGNPTGDAFDIDYVAHEMGHQFGANHTFNGTLGSASGNRNNNTAMEPGSGSSIMAYAGICGNDDLQPHSDPYFYNVSIDEIRAYIATISSTGTSTSTGNTAPTVSAGSAFAIPANTPFTLTASGSDPDGDPVTFEWGERDFGAAQTLSAMGTTDNGAAVITRPVVPTTDPTRTFPSLPRILGGFTTDLTQKGFVATRLPGVARAAFKWRVIARDNRAGGGGVNTADVSLQVVASTAFSITNSDINAINGSWAGGATKTLTWNVGATTGATINTTNVNILFSTDGGTTFPTTIASNVPNNGSANIVVPTMQTSTARIKIVPVGNIYFDINNANFTVTAPQSFATGAPMLQAGSDTGASNTDDITKLNNNGGVNALSFDIPSTINGATVNLYIDGTLYGSGTGNGGTITIATDGLTAFSNGGHSVTARQIESGKVESPDSASLGVTVDAAVPVIFSPGDQTFEIVNTAGTNVSFSPATAFDNIDASPTITYDHNPGSSFLPDNTIVHATATDDAGNQATTFFTITLEDAPYIVRGSGAAYAFTGSVGAQTLTISAGQVSLIDDADLYNSGLTVKGQNGANLSINQTQHLAALILETGATATLAAGGDKFIRTSGLSIDGTSKLDINDNDMLVDYSSGSVLSTIEGLIFFARNNGAWNGFGLRSGSAATLVPAITTLGAIEASDYKSIYGPSATFNGETIGNECVLIKYTYYGDANFNGKVDGGDYARTDITFGQEGSAGNIGGWINGDFNLDGRVNGSDYGVIDFAFGNQGGTL